MSLNIKNERTVALVDELATLTGETKTAAIDAAVRERIGRIRESVAEQAMADRLVERAAIDELLHEIWSANQNAPLPEREQNDAELYDDDGLPR